MESDIFYTKKRPILIGCSLSITKSLPRYSLMGINTIKQESKENTEEELNLFTFLEKKIEENIKSNQEVINEKTEYNTNQLSSNENPIQIENKNEENEREEEDNLQYKIVEDEEDENSVEDNLKYKIVEDEEDEKEKTDSKNIIEEEEENQHDNGYSQYSSYYNNYNQDLDNDSDDEDFFKKQEESNKNIEKKGMKIKKLNEILEEEVIEISNSLSNTGIHVSLNKVLDKSTIIPKKINEPLNTFHESMQSLRKSNTYQEKMEIYEKISKISNSFLQDASHYGKTIIRGKLLYL